MNKKILISLSVIGAVAAIVIGGTIAYFSNTEKSVGNTFIAGAIDLKIDNECHYNGRVCRLYENNNGFEPGYYWDGDPVNGRCDCTWEPMDLKGKAIFSFLDVKPGDWGESTISLHVDSNPAWICAEISNVTSTENGCNPPELKAEQTAYGVGYETCGTPGVNEGELHDNLYFDIWRDDCDNIHQEGEGYIIQGAKLTDMKWPIADSQHGQGPIRDACIGVAWYVPSEVGNIIQGDSVTGDITFNAYQARNNARFVCNPPTTGTLTVIKHVVDGTANAGNFTINVTGANPNPASFPGSESGTNVSLEAGSYSVSEYPVSGYTATYSADCSGIIASGETKICTVTNSFDTGTITVHKVVVNNEVGTKNAGNFQMRIDGSNVNQGQDYNVSVGDHTVSEADNFGYVVTYSADCPGGVATVTKDTNTTCIVTNTYPFFTVTVTKVLVIDNGGNATTSNFNLFVDSIPVISGVPKKVAVGTRFINESGVIGYAAIFSGDCDPSTQLLTGANGDNKFCTITNDDIAPVITLVKRVIGGALPIDFIMRVDGVPVPSGGSKSVTSNAGHTITEDALSGYRFTSMTGTGSQDSTCPVTLGDTVTLNEGEVITCTITNTVNP